MFPVLLLAITALVIWSIHRDVADTTLYLCETHECGIVSRLAQDQTSNSFGDGVLLHVPKVNLMLELKLKVNPAHPEVAKAKQICTTC